MSSVNCPKHYWMFSPQGRSHIAERRGRRMCRKSLRSLGRGSFYLLFSSPRAINNGGGGVAASGHVRNGGGLLSIYRVRQLFAC